MYVQVITFQLQDMTEAEFRTLCDQLAPQWAAIPGMISKVWLANAATNTYGGVYQWEDRAAMERYLQSDLFAAVAANPQFANVASVDFGIIEGPTRLTHGLTVEPAQPAEHAAQADGRTALSLFVDFHPNWNVNPASIERLRRVSHTGEADQYGVRQVDFLYNPEGRGAYCVLEAPDEEAVRKHHGTMSQEPMRVESLR